jgi:flagellar basal-body rod protein FlgB
MDHIGKLMDVAARRHDAYAVNIANVNTPGYKRSEVKFEDVLEGRGAELKRRILETEPRLVQDTTSAARFDGNNVTLDKELALLRKNSLLYRTFTEILSAKIRLLRESITGRG